MNSAFKTRSIDVLRPVVTGTDELNEPIYSYERQTVLGVLVQPADTDTLGVERPQSQKIDVIVHFPKSYEKSLFKCQLDIDGVRFSVVGNPMAYPKENVPGEFNRSVQAVFTDG